DDDVRDFQHACVIAHAAFPEHRVIRLVPDFPDADALSLVPAVPQSQRAAGAIPLGALRNASRPGIVPIEGLAGAGRIVAIGEDRLVKIADGLIVAVEFGYAEQNRVGSQTMFDIAGHQLIIGVPRPAPGLWFDAIPVKWPAVPARAKLQRAL